MHQPSVFVKKLILILEKMEKKHNIVAKNCYSFLFQFTFKNHSLRKICYATKMKVTRKLKKHYKRNFCLKQKQQQEK